MNRIKEKPRILALNGAKCDSDIWSRIKESLADYKITYASYPHDVLKNASSVKDAVFWAAGEYESKPYDVILEHSMGGQAARKADTDRKPPGFLRALLPQSDDGSQQRSLRR